MVVKQEIWLRHCSPPTNDYDVKITLEGEDEWVRFIISLLASKAFDIKDIEKKYV